MKTTEDSWLNLASSHVVRIAFLAVVSPIALAAPPTSPICERTPKAKQTALLVVDSDYRPIGGSVLQLGDVDFSVAREANRRFMVVAPPQAQPMTSQGGVEMRSDLELLQKCPGKNVFALNFNFDGSTLAAGAFSQPLSVFQDEVGMKGPPLNAPVESVAGTIRRFWIKADVAPKRRSAADVLELRLTNTGNIKSSPLRFLPLADAPDVRVSVNECEARLLAPAESCVIDIAVGAPAPTDEAFDWPVETGQDAILTLQFERRRGSALTVNVLNR